MMADDGEILVCGNGGSAGDTQHVAAEFINRFAVERHRVTRAGFDNRQWAVNERS